MNEFVNPIRPTTIEAIRLARTLLRTVRYGAIAVLDAATGRPLASRVGVATDIDGTPIILVSGLAAHTPALLAHPACSILLGHAGKGDPLAHARVTVHCMAEKIERSSPDQLRISRRYLNHNPKGALYANLGDFVFFRLVVESASLNGGFGKAFNLTPGDLLSDPKAAEDIAISEQEHLDELNETHAEALALHAARSEKTANSWKLIGIDPDGFDLASGDQIIRSNFPSGCDSSESAVKTLLTMLPYSP
ncbi:pyridoxamine 5'-phosphate oxidase family protein [Falsochrobactrum sp. TDYN1]|uniref:Pyridoxamine 5'-phosphate oxidase family protein n=1 Tax=Falsochrobactrum tianjinense TaxID=2706015 RepID=A0A949UTQ4_9HYPH|nr:pyridoxamine 5'-phosphate oxidase family protein [Falsochrobactrum sp. TDYN1]MBV2144060.1 pyridoxamine 5'-phosphate oxidase family protein [Falsochrobactrum sp. TDYN1]